MKLIRHYHVYVVMKNECSRCKLTLTRHASVYELQTNHLELYIASNTIGEY